MAGVPSCCCSSVVELRLTGATLRALRGEHHEGLAYFTKVSKAPQKHRDDQPGVKGFTVQL